MIACVDVVVVVLVVVVIIIALVIVAILIDPAMKMTKQADLNDLI